MLFAPPLEGAEWPDKIAIGILFAAHIGSGGYGVKADLAIFGPMGIVKVNLSLVGGG